jgi:hypothetical protein
MKANPNDKITITWHKDDIIQRAQENQNLIVTDKQAREILKLIENHYDCNIGITWNDLDYWTGFYFKENNIKLEFYENESENVTD